jgi:hypothetical protein
VYLPITSSDIKNHTGYDDCVCCDVQDNEEKMGNNSLKNSAKKGINISVLEIWHCEYGDEAMRMNKLYSRIWAQRL